MFDATKGQQAVTDQVETLSDEFAARFDTLQPRDQLVFLEKANQLLDNPDQVSAFQAGTYAQNSAGQPAAQLGTGRPAVRPTDDDIRKAVATILGAPQLPNGFKQLMRRGYDQAASDFLDPQDDGTPKIVTDTQTQRDDYKRERDTALGDLANERDPNRNGSLAQKLAAVTAERDSLRATGGYDQNIARNMAGEVIAAIDAQMGKMGGKVDGKDLVMHRFIRFTQHVGLQRPSTP